MAEGEVAAALGMNSSDGSRWGRGGEGRARWRHTGGEGGDRGEGLLWRREGGEGEGMDREEASERWMCRGMQREREGERCVGARVRKGWASRGLVGRPGLLACD